MCILDTALLVGKGLHCISRKNQLAYKCRIPESDDVTVFHICVNNLRVDKTSVQPFADKVHIAAPAFALIQGPDPDYDAHLSF